MNNGITRWAPLTGLLFIVVLILSFALGGEPPNPADDPVEEIVDFYSDDAKMFGAALQAVAGAILIFFSSYVARRFRAAGAQATSTLILVGGAIIATGLAIDGTISFALADFADEIDPAAVEGLAALWHADFLPAAMGMLVFLMGFGLAILRHGELPTWIGWVAIVASLTAISPAFPVAGIFAVLLIAISAVIFARRERERSVETA
jgi:hypothetical protein